MNQPDKSTILIADDAPENIALLSEVLSDDYKIRTAMNGERVLTLCDGDKLPDLILLDIMMPGMSGFDVCGYLKKQARTKDIPVIFITGRTDVTDETHGLDIGAVDYITKPFSPAIVRARVRTHLAIFNQKKEIETAYSKLKDLESLRDNLTHMIVHDMRGPLQIIKGYVELLSCSISSNDIFPKYLSKLEISCNGLIEMIGSLLDVSRFESGEMPVQMEHCDIIPLIKKVKDTYQVACSGTQKIEIISEADTLAMNCDQNIIERVIGNLVTNAIRFSPQDGTIIIRLDKEPDSIKLSVIDNGKGIPPEHRQKVFEKFGQAELSKENTKHSTGLGLTFCKLAVEAHGGTIGISGEPGTNAIWFSVPQDKNEVLSA